MSQSHEDKRTPEQLPSYETAQSGADALGLWWTHALKGDLPEHGPNADDPAVMDIARNLAQEMHAVARQSRITDEQWVAFAHELTGLVEEGRAYDPGKYSQISCQYDAPQVMIEAAERSGIERQDLELAGTMLGAITTWRRYYDDTEMIEAAIGHGWEQIWPRLDPSVESSTQ